MSAAQIPPSVPTSNVPAANVHTAQAHVAGPPRRRVLIAAVVLALVAAGAWFAWLGWDTEYHYVDGVAQGPYRAWQVVGAGATVVVAALLTWWTARGTAATLTLPIAAAIGFAVPWTVQAAATDDSGLFAVGAILLLAGITLGIGAVLGVASVVDAVVGSARRRRGA